MSIVNEELAKAFLSEVVDEYTKARTKFPPMHSGHEGWAIIKEELDEMWEAVRMQLEALDEKGRTRPQAMQEEITQVAAMAVAFYCEVCKPAFSKGGRAT